MTDFAVGDRVGWLDGKTMRDGRIVRTTSTSVYVDAGGDDPVLFIGDGCDDLTSIEEPQPWQGECDREDCHKTLTPATASMWFRDGRPHYYCDYHYAMAYVTCPVKRQQEAALARSRAWMHERHPDDPRWQEAE